MGIVILIMGEAFGAMLTYAGYGQIIIKSKAKTPVYLLINDECILFNNTSHLWGLKTKKLQSS